MQALTYAEITKQTEEIIALLRRSGNSDYFRDNAHGAYLLWLSLAKTIKSPDALGSIQSDEKRLCDLVNSIA